MIAIADYDMGNPKSIKNMLLYMGRDSVITSCTKTLSNCDLIILPGVGSFDVGVQNLQKKGLFTFLQDFVQNDQKKLLGICLGMQLMFEGSEEGNETGLSLLPGSFIKFKSDGVKKVPHMGWNQVIYNKNCKDVFLGNKVSVANEFDARYYFVHSYYLPKTNAKFECGHTKYINEFCSAVHQENIYGFQFHPEKSHKYGLNLISNIIEES